MKEGRTIVINKIEIIIRKVLKAVKNITLKQKYFSFIGVMMVLFLLVIFQAQGKSQASSYIAIDNFEAQNFSNSELTIVKRNYNPTEKTFRMDVVLSEINQSNDLSQNEMLATAITKKNSSEALDVDIYKVTENYFSFVARDVPENYGAVRFDLIYKDNENNNPMSGQYYSEEEQSETVNDTLLNLSIEDLKLDVIRNEIELTKKLIRENEFNLESNLKRIGKLRRTIEGKKEEKELQVGEDLLNTEEKIITFENNIESVQENNIEIISKVNELTEKIKLLENKLNE